MPAPSVNIAVMQKQPRAALVRIGINGIQALGVEGRRTPDDAVNFVSFCQQQLSQK